MRAHIVILAALVCGVASCTPGRYAKPSPGAPPSAVTFPERRPLAWGQLFDGSQRSMKARLSKKQPAEAAIVKVVDLAPDFNGARGSDSEHTVYRFRYNPFDFDMPCAPEMIGGVAWESSLKEPPVLVGFCSASGKAIYELVIQW